MVVLLVTGGDRRRRRAGPWLRGRQDCDGSHPRWGGQASDQANASAIRTGADSERADRSHARAPRGLRLERQSVLGSCSSAIDASLSGPSGGDHPQSHSLCSDLRVEWSTSAAWATSGGSGRGLGWWVRRVLCSPDPVARRAQWSTDRPVRPRISDPIRCSATDGPDRSVLRPLVHLQPIGQHGGSDAPAVVLAYAHGIGLSGRTPSPVTIGARIACLSSYFHFLIRMGMVNSNPCDLVERPRQSPSPARGYSADEV